MSTDIHTIFSTGDCPSHEDLLAYYKGELKGEEKNRIEHHLMECEMCSDELGGMSKMRDVDALPQIVAGMQSEISAERRKVIRMSPRILLAAAAAVLVLLIGALFLFRSLPMNEKEKILARQNRQPATAEMQAPVPDTLKPPASPARSSSGKQLLALVHHPEKKEAEREMDASIAEKMKSPEPGAVQDKIIVESLAPMVIQKDTTSQVRPIPTASGAVSENATNMLIQQPATRLYEDKSAKRQMKSNAGRTRVDISAAMHLYDEEDYRQAAILFETRLQADTTSSADRYYLADCCFHLKDYANAKKLLQKIVNDPKDLFYKRAGDLLKEVEGKIN